MQVVCQAPGSAVAGTSVWDKLTDGTYVTDSYVSTPSKTGYSAPLPRCGYPYQVMASPSVNERAGAGPSHPVAGQLPNGALAWVVCQTAGSTVKKTRVWDKLQDGHWVSDFYVATPSKTTYSGPDHAAEELARWRPGSTMASTAGSVRVRPAHNYAASAPSAANITRVCP